MAETDLTADELRKSLAYNPETGVFAWIRPRSFGGSNTGAVAQPNKKGYVRIVVNGRKHMAHRLAWLYVYGVWPKYEVDHVNGVRSDNRIANLRDVSHKLNSQNRRKANVGNKSGFLGVAPRGKRKWEATIKVEGKTVALGVLDSPEAAHEMFLTAKRKLHEGCTL